MPFSPPSTVKEGDDMNSRSNGFTATVASRGDRVNLIVCGLWLRVVFVGMSLLGAGIAVLLDGAAVSAPVLASLGGGGLPAAFAWRRTRAALDRMDSVAMSEVPPAVHNARPTRQLATGEGGGRTAAALE
jgi:hypothetical protein